jgi:hypothetical protein
MELLVSMTLRQALFLCQTAYSLDVIDYKRKDEGTKNWQLQSARQGGNRLYLSGDVVAAMFP